MLARVLLLVCVWSRTGEGIIPNFTVTDCSITHLELTLWQTTSRVNVAVACIATNTTCVIGDKTIPKKADFNETVGQLLPISLTQKAEDPCQHMSVTPSKDGFCTIQMVSTRTFDDMKFSSQHECALSTSGETISSTASVTSQVNLGSSTSIAMMVQDGGETRPTSPSSMVTIAVSVAFPTGLLLLSCVTLGGLFLITHFGCRQARIRMRNTLQIDHVIPNMDLNVTFGIPTDVISCDSVTAYDVFEEGEALSVHDVTQEAYSLSIKKRANIDNFTSQTADYGNDYSAEPVKALLGYIVTSSSIPESEV